MRAILAAVIVIAFAGAAYAVDGVIEINQARALAGGVTPGDTPGFPVIISQRGSYRLTGDLIPGADIDGILVVASNVTIDLNGFAIVGPRDGISLGGVNYKNLFITNGSILSVGRTGINLGSAGRVERVRISTTSTGRVGIDGHDATDILISGCTVSGFLIAGIDVSNGLVTGNVITENRNGILISNGLVTGNTIRESAVDPLRINVGGSAGYAGNSIEESDSGHTVVGGVQIGPNVCGAALCP